mmetsp:Transcript_15843/g.51644  ORF Transcript_15843/g.51644 Transcript_15843/m.51644 type:complete len:253 (-) Transcript_15843:385-1143(-)
MRSKSFGSRSTPSADVSKNWYMNAATKSGSSSLAAALNVKRFALHSRSTRPSRTARLSRRFSSNTTRARNARVATSSSAARPQSKSAGDPSARIMTLPGCGSAWKKPSRNMVAPIASTARTTAPRHARGATRLTSTTSSPVDIGASSASKSGSAATVTPSRNSQVSTCRDVRLPTAVGTTTSPKPRAPKSAAARSMFRHSFRKSSSRGNDSSKQSSTARRSSYAPTSRRSFANVARSDRFAASSGKTAATSP